MKRKPAPSLLHAVRTACRARRLSLHTERAYVRWIRRFVHVHGMQHPRTLALGELAWIWARSEQTVPIPGVKTVEQVEVNCKAEEFGPLTPGQMTELDEILGRT